MIPREELQKLMWRRLKKAMPRSDVERLMLEIAALEEEWEELDPARLDMASEIPVQCFECWLEDQLRQGADIRLYFKNRQPEELQAS